MDIINKIAHFYPFKTFPHGELHDAVVVWFYITLGWSVLNLVVGLITISQSNYKIGFLRSFLFLLFYFIYWPIISYLLILISSYIWIIGGIVLSIISLFIFIANASDNDQPLGWIGYSIFDNLEEIAKQEDTKRKHLKMYDNLVNFKM